MRCAPTSCSTLYLDTVRRLGAFSLTGWSDEAANLNGTYHAAHVAQHLIRPTMAASSTATIRQSGHRQALVMHA